MNRQGFINLTTQMLESHDFTGVSVTDCDKSDVLEVSFLADVGRCTFVFPRFFYDHTQALIWLQDQVTHDPFTGERARYRPSKAEKTPEADRR